MKIKIRSLCAISVALVSIDVFACQPHYYKDDVGICWPDGGYVVEAVNPVPDLLNIGGAIVKGDVNALTQAIGGAIVKTTCPACAIMLTGNDKVFVEKVVGRGWLVYMTTGSPMIVLADATSNIAKGIDLGTPEPAVFSAPPSQVRAGIAYSASEATCMVRNIANGSITAGWVDPPVLRAANGVEKVYPNVSVLPVDTLKITSKNDCADVPEGQEKLTEIVIKIGDSRSIPVEEPVMKYFFTGKAA
ncbi:hypothetical protein [Pseudomonas sp.]|jgi:hypothetical protein|uniref:hypothetical protein n=1 Tax=Pseudomonas sp. TaxID=306 RepID=UPI002ED98252